MLCLSGMQTQVSAHVGVSIHSLRVLVPGSCEASKQIQSKLSSLFPKIHAVVPWAFSVPSGAGFFPAWSVRQTQPLPPCCSESR